MSRFLLPVFLLFVLGYPFTGLAQKDTTLLVAGLQQQVEITRDQWGINHIYARNEHDLFFAQGYCAARDRLFQFEIWRRQATGTSAEVFGVRELKRDIGTRLFKYRGDMKKELQHYHAHGEAIINAYVQGVNAYIEEALQNPSTLPVEFQLLGILPRKWTTEVVISRHQGIQYNITEELNIGRSVSLAGEGIVKDLLWFHPKDPLLTLDTSLRENLLSKDILELYTAFRRDIVFEPADLQASNSHRYSMDPSYQPAERGNEGSNNWVVSGKKTASGFPMLADDPHRKIAIPSLRYMVHLVAPGWNVIGGGEPEIPGVSIGHNEHGAWGITVYETDAEDLYVYDLNPADLSQYRYKGKWKKMEVIREKVAVKNQPVQTVTLRYSLHGPITYIDSANLKAYAVRSGSREPGGAPYLSSLRINQARNWESFREACSYSNIPALNMVWADKYGNIGWQAVGIVPVRKNFSGLVPVPGDGRYEWGGFLPIKERPHLYNPAKGFVATANQHLAPADYKHWDAMGYTWPDAFRGLRLNEILEKENGLTVARFKELQTDYLSRPAASLIPLLLRTIADTGLVDHARKRMLNWNYTLDKTSVEAGIYVAWERQIMSRAAELWIPASLKGLINLQLTKIMQWIELPDKHFGADPIRGRDAFLRETFQAAIKQLTDEFGPSPQAWTYGQRTYKHTAMVHALSDFVPGLRPLLNTDTLARGGYGHTIGSTGNTNNQSTGASFRLIVDTGDWDAALMTNSPGQSGDPASPFYKNLFTSWANDQYFPAYFSPDRINQAAAEKLVLKPVIKK